MVPQFVTNVVGPTIVAQTFLPLVDKSTRKTIVNVSSTLGSIGSDFSADQTSYSVSKAALNMLVRPQALCSFSARGWVPWFALTRMCSLP